MSYRASGIIFRVCRRVWTFSFCLSTRHCDVTLLEPPPLKFFRCICRLASLPKRKAKFLKRASNVFSYRLAASAFTSAFLFRLSQCVARSLRLFLCWHFCQTPLSRVCRQLSVSQSLQSVRQCVDQCLCLSPCPVCHHVPRHILFWLVAQ